MSLWRLNDDSMRTLRLLTCTFALFAATGCAARKEVRAAGDAERAAGTQTASAAGAPSESLATYIGKLRERSVRAVATSSAGSVEESVPALRSALVTLRTKPTAALHRAAAQEYRRLDILDKAHEHLTSAVALDPRDAAAWDGLARIWRDWHLPYLALADAHRALYFAPDSPIVNNTLGTVLQAVGRPAEARARFERALALDSGAAYALSNLCYGWLLEGQTRQASEACRRALDLQPDLQHARNNLALAYDAGGDTAAAEKTLAGGGDPARAQYNLGIMHLGRRRYAEAARAFDAARALRPASRTMDIMARQARALASAEVRP